MYVPPDHVNSRRHSLMSITRISGEARSTTGQVSPGRSRHGSGNTKHLCLVYDDPASRVRTTVPYRAKWGHREGGHP